MKVCCTGRAARVIGMLVLAFLLFTAQLPGRPVESAPAATGGQLVVAEPTPPDTFDPIAHSNFNNWYVWQLVYETLVVVQPDGRVAPMLAASWQVSPDELTYTFRLRSGIKFHNGAALTAEDVVYSFDRLRTKGIPYAKDRFPTLAGVRAVDASTVAFQLRKKDSSFLNNLGDPFVVGSAILSRQENSDPATRMVGTGPLRMVSYTPGTELVLERNRDYWQQGGSGVDRLVIRFVKEPQSAVAALISGDVSLIYPTPETFLALRKTGRVKVLSVPTASTWQINMGSVKPPLSIVDVRRAIALSIGREGVARLALFGEGTPTGPFPPGHPWAVALDRQPYYKRDVARARQLLAKAGYPNGLELAFMYPTGLGQSETYRRITEVLQSQLAESGIRIRIEALETNVWLDKLVKANYDLTMTNPPYFSDPSLYVIPRAGRQGPTPAELQWALDRAAEAGQEQLPDVYRQIQLIEAELAYPFTGVVAENKWIAFRPDLVDGVRADFTLTRRLYFGLKRSAR
jgi:peptide/nickel transport system substrate-binding protein